MLCLIIHKLANYVNLGLKDFMVFTKKNLQALELCVSA